MNSQPFLFLAIPAFEHFFGNGIRQSKRDEHYCSRLRPMRSTMLVDGCIRFRIEKLAEHASAPVVCSDQK